MAKNTPVCRAQSIWRSSTSPPMWKVFEAVSSHPSRHATSVRTIVWPERFVGDMNGLRGFLKSVIASRFCEAISEQ